MPFGFIKRAAFKLMTKAAGAVLGEITNLGKSLQDMVESPMKGFIGKIKNGAWEGEDADAFVEEVQRDLLPKITDLIAAIFGISGGVQKSIDNIISADKKSYGRTSKTLDLFQF